jgi:hypothetical protein
MTATRSVAETDTPTTTVELVAENRYIKVSFRNTENDTS